MVTVKASSTAVGPTVVQQQQQQQEGIKSYYKTKIEELEAVIHGKTQDLRRLEAQRNQLNGKGDPLYYQYQYHIEMLKLF